MANRIIQESICSSESIDRLSQGAEIAFYRLIVCVDDYGRIDGRLPMLKAKMYPLRTGMDLDEIDQYMEELELAGLIWSYMVDGRIYYQMRTWDKYQRVRNKRSKCPAPLTATCDNSPHPAASCGQMSADCGLNPYPNPYPNPNPEPDVGVASDTPADNPPQTAADCKMLQMDPEPTTPASGYLGDEITPEELEAERDIQDQAEGLVRAYGLPFNRRTLDAITQDIRLKGVGAVMTALDTATDADTKGGISLKFYRACLNNAGNGGHGRKGRDAPGDMIRHSREEFERSSAAAIIDLDEED